MPRHAVVTPPSYAQLHARGRRRKTLARESSGDRPTARRSRETGSPPADAANGEASERRGAFRGTARCLQDTSGSNATPRLLFSEPWILRRAFSSDSRCRRASGLAQPTHASVRSSLRPNPCVPDPVNARSPIARMRPFPPFPMVYRFTAAPHPLRDPLMLNARHAASNSPQPCCCRPASVPYGSVASSPTVRHDPGVDRAISLDSSFKSHREGGFKWMPPICQTTRR